MAGPWRGWYHAIATTYGTWLKGDSRGWRSYKHREHVEGDYRNPPPPGRYELEFRRSKQRLKYDPVLLPPAARRAVRDALAERLSDLNAEVVTLAVAKTHAHAVLRFPNWNEPDFPIPRMDPGNMLADGRDPVPRHLFGVALAHASHVGLHAGWKRPGPLWGRRAKFVPVADRGHQLEAVKYVVSHAAREGAALWMMWARVPKHYGIFVPPHMLSGP